MKSLAGLPIEKLKRAVEIREQIDSLGLELNELLGVSPYNPGNNELLKFRKRHELSAEGRERIAAAQRLRWSKYNAARGNAAAVPSSKKQRLSAEGRARVSAAVKARWERFRAAKILATQQ